MPTRSQYIARKAAGLCVTCGAPAFQNYGRTSILCGRHRERQAAYFAEKRMKKEVYICRTCNKEFYGFGERAFCSRKCSNENNNSSEKSKKGWEKRKKPITKTFTCQNLNCGKEFPKKYASDSRKYCSIACANSMPKNWHTKPEKPKQKTYQEKFTAGLCVNCGYDTPALTGERLCQKHFDYAAQYNALKYQKDKQKIAAPVSVEIIKELSLADQVRELKQQQRLTIGQVHLLFPGVSRQLREAISAAYYGR